MVPGRDSRGNKTEGSWEGKRKRHLTNSSNHSNCNIWADLFLGGISGISIHGDIQLSTKP